MKILVVGSGGREHALAWRIAQSPGIQTVLVAPGNAGTASEPELKNVLENECAGTIPQVQQIEALLAFAKVEKVRLTVVGPEAPLAAGIVDRFRAQGLLIVGPTQASARLESSKTYAKEFMVRNNIPTARYKSFTQSQAAHDYIDQQGAPIVIKADGLASGKGVFVALNMAEAHAAVDKFLVSSDSTQSGEDEARVVIEEFIDGVEVSFIVLADGKHAVALASSKDHKRLQDGDLGPNTGGMGAFSPAPIVSPTMHAKIMNTIIEPTLDGMAREGSPYTGFLYAGLMILPDGTLRVLEFNCRLGDPEAQPILMRLRGNFLQLLEMAVAGKLDKAELMWDRRIALSVVLAAPGYPSAPETGGIIEGWEQLPQCDDLKVFHAATQLDKNGKILTAGGRVLSVTVLDETMNIARQRVYEAVDNLNFLGKQYRKDIGNQFSRR